MPKQKHWKRSEAMKNRYRSDHLRTFKETTKTIKRNMNLCLFEDLEKTERRLQYISSQNERHTDGENSTNKIAQLKHEKQQMKEEIALLKLKIDVLLSMLAQATAVTNIQHDELKRLRNQISKT